ncbi:MAG: hypothetical protein HOJ89_04040, partial [Opitutales bacterium]|nr:hypothetical protein [Opitutales bacterium]
MPLFWFKRRFEGCWRSSDACGRKGNAKDSSVSVNASTVNGYIFEEWTGDEVSSEPSIQIFMDDDRNVTANFGND